MPTDRSFPDRLFAGAPVIPTGPPEQEVIMGHMQDDVVGKIGAVPVCKSCGSERVARDAWACWNPEYGMWDLEHVFDDAHCHACEEATTLVWKRLDAGKPRMAIRELNDLFRREGRGNGTIVVTPGVQACGQEFFQRAFKAVRDFAGFSEDNDPWGEHDYGAVEVDREKVFWKIDYYDPTLTQGSENPANEAVTHRVLTIMLASEY
jgi:hypothetical protein